MGGVAERVGFEPTIRYNRIPDFESGAFDHSAISPEKSDSNINIEEHRMSRTHCSGKSGRTHWKTFRI